MTIDHPQHTLPLPHLSERVPAGRGSVWHCFVGVGLFLEAFFISALPPRCPCRRRGGGQESKPLLFLFIRHNQSYLRMKVISIFFIIAHERDYWVIKIHSSDDDEPKQRLFLYRREDMRHPI